MLCCDLSLTATAATAAESEATAVACHEIAGLCPCVFSRQPSGLVSQFGQGLPTEGNRRDPSCVDTTLARAEETRSGEAKASEVGAERPIHIRPAPTLDVCCAHVPTCAVVIEDRKWVRRGPVLYK